jgi:hypothetical protein
VLYAARPIEPSAIPRRPSSAQIVVERETQRVHHAWKETDKKAEIVAVVQQLQSVALDAARPSGARTEAENLTVTERQIAGELVGALTKAIRVAGGT